MKMYICIYILQAVQLSGLVEWCTRLSFVSFFSTNACGTQINFFLSLVLIRTETS